MKLLIEVKDTVENLDSVTSFFKEMKAGYTIIDIDAVHPKGWNIGMTGMNLVNAQITLVKN